MERPLFSRSIRERPTFGFSLLELSIAVLITGIVAAVAVPKYMSSLNRYRTEVAAQRLAQDIEMCRRQARFTGQNVTLDISYGKNYYRILNFESPLRPGSPYEVVLGESYNSPSLCPVSNGQLMTESRTTSSDLTIIFDRYGVPSQRAEIGIRCGEASSIVQLSSEGVVTRL